MTTKKLIMPILVASVLLSSLFLYCQSEEKGIYSGSTSPRVYDNKAQDIPVLDTLPVTSSSKISLNEASLESICCNVDLLQLLINESNMSSRLHGVSQNGQYYSEIISWNQDTLKVKVTALKDGTYKIIPMEPLGFEGNENIIPLNSGGILHDHFDRENIARIVYMNDGDIIKREIVNNTGEQTHAFSYIEESNSYYYSTVDHNSDRANKSVTLRNVSEDSVEWATHIPEEYISSKVFYSELKSDICAFTTRNQDLSNFLYITSDLDGKILLRIPLDFTTAYNTTFKIIVTNNKKFLGLFNAAGYVLIDLDRMEVYKTAKDTPLPESTVCNSMASTDSAIFIVCYTRKKVPHPKGGNVTVPDQHFLLKIANDKYELREIEAINRPILTIVNDTLVFASLDSSGTSIQLQRIE